MRCIRNFFLWESRQSWTCRGLMSRFRKTCLRQESLSFLFSKIFLFTSRGPLGAAKIPLVSERDCKGTNFFLFSKYFREKFRKTFQHRFQHRRNIVSPRGRAVTNGLSLPGRIELRHRPYLTFVFAEIGIRPVCLNGCVGDIYRTRERCESTRPAKVPISVIGTLGRIHCIH